MTAVVGVINKQAVAIAGDSAATISTHLGTMKVYNSALKIFSLSKHNPVGIAIYQNAEFMGIPWETIIKEFRKYLGTREFDTLELYKPAFYEHIMGEMFSKSVSSTYIDEILQQAQRAAKEEILSFIKKNDVPVDKWKNILDEITFNSFSTDLSKDQRFESCLDGLIKFQEDNSSKAVFTKDQLEIILKYHLSYSPAYTGLIFFGFGKKEIFPSIYSDEVIAIYNSKLYSEDHAEANSYKVDTENTSSIIPFAQRDVVDTLLFGINPDIEGYILNQFHKFGPIMFDTFLDKYFQGISTKNRATLLDSFESEYRLELQQWISDVLNKYKREKYIQPLVESLAFLGKEDMAELAESLVYMTYLKRRVSLDAESVGGPIDVAIVTKGDGLIWIKRKHYFDRNLNEHFFQNYLNK